MWHVGHTLDGYVKCDAGISINTVLSHQPRFTIHSPIPIWADVLDDDYLYFSTLITPVYHPSKRERRGLLEVDYAFSVGTPLSNIRLRDSGMFQNLPLELTEAILYYLDYPSVRQTLRTASFLRHLSEKRLYHEVNLLKGSQKRQGGLSSALSRHDHQ